MSSRTAWWLLAWGCLWLVGCRKSRPSQSNGGAVGIVADSVWADIPPEGWVPFDETQAGFKIQEVDFKYLTAKSKFSFKNDRQDIDNATINLRVRKDSLIWFSVNTVGFEVARGMISPQEIVVLDKFHKDYHTFSYPELSQRFQFNLSYGLLQSLLVGNLPVPRQPGQLLYREDDHDRLLLRQKDDRAVIDNYIGKSSQHLEGLRVVQPATQNMLMLQYGDFKTLNGYQFPFASWITLTTRAAPDQPLAQTEIGFSHSRVDLVESNPGFPFSIPASYKKR